MTDDIKNSSYASHGPSVDLFCAAIRALVEVHGNRCLAVAHDTRLDRIRQKLGEIEQLYIELPLVKEGRAVKEGGAASASASASQQEAKET